jgi:hypothetical protein
MPRTSQKSHDSVVTIATGIGNHSAATANNAYSANAKYPWRALPPKVTAAPSSLVR